ncbi:hypothetical protein ABVK25_007745 [Lepraria finkii]|uniref:F-box domain-containing protein n=1 Tax=Lepraria finkii TaxID=1340010 RepID=A0ABR4B3T3_9LECA
MDQHHSSHRSSKYQTAHNTVAQNLEASSWHSCTRKSPPAPRIPKDHAPTRISRAIPPTPKTSHLAIAKPPEIAHVLRIAKYLDPVSRMSLKYTSQYLYHSLKYTIASELWYPKRRSTPTLGPNGQVRDSIPGETERQKRKTVDPARQRRLRWLTLLMKDGLFGDGKSICAPCLSVHEDSLFLPSELENPDRERECLVFTGKVWICPHLQLRYDEVTLSKPRPSRPHPHYSDLQYFATDPKGKNPAAKLESSQPSCTVEAQPQLSSAEAKRAHRRAKQDITNLLGTTPVSKINQECHHCASMHVTTTSFTKSRGRCPIMHLRPHILARASLEK